MPFGVDSEVVGYARLWCNGQAENRLHIIKAILFAILA